MIQFIFSLIDANSYFLNTISEIECEKIKENQELNGLENEFNVLYNQ